jgi:hypothetical protein
MENAHTFEDTRVMALEYRQEMLDEAIIQMMLLLTIFQKPL